MKNSILCLILSALLFLSAHTCESGSRTPVRARHGMVVAADPLAARAGEKILEAGGNAIDAAVATGFALAVTYPGAGNLGGGGFMVIRMADGKTAAIDYREKAPAASTRSMYLDSAGNFRPELSTVGHLAVGVPGSVAGLLEALERYGTMKRAQVMTPALRLAEEGFPLSRELAHGMQSMIPSFSKFPASMKSFTRHGLPYKEGEMWKQPELARTLEAIATNGRDGFYRGRVADLLVAEMKRGHGLITHKDLESYVPIVRDCVRGTYRGIEVISMPPPSSGGIALIQLLNILEPFDLRSYGWNSAKSAHVMVEAMRRVYADRAEYLGDPDFYTVPQRGLLSKRYAEAQRRTIDTERATKSASVTHGVPVAYESNETTHYSVVDRFGNCVSVTTTLNGAYGSCVTVEGAGFLLNNEMDDFSAKPGTPNMFGLIGAEANAIAPGKRMLSSMAPTILVKDHAPFMVVGSPGGSTIITSVLQTIVNVIDYGMNIREAIEAPRIHHQWLPDTLYYERHSFSADTRTKLRQMGHVMQERRGTQGLVEGIVITPGEGVIEGASDPRGYGVAAGY
ncbi:MAG TPA: gamma-glutamyltransferase [Bacteroidota bacterium]|nr:gamma-glutamyltransferase [Bacteroidota bacterium]